MAALPGTRRCALQWAVRRCARGTLALPAPAPRRLSGLASHRTSARQQPSWAGAGARLIATAAAPGRPFATTVDEDEVAKFGQLSAKWWDRDGPEFGALHKLNKVRVRYVREAIAAHFGAARSGGALRILDVGCGGGILAEPLARLGFSVQGIDASESAIAVAQAHAERDADLGDGRLAYQQTSAEALLDAGAERFDVVVASEVIEHVSDPELFISTCSQLMKDDGLLVVTTINRTPAAQALAIFAAENVLGMAQKGTHEYEKLVTPDELEAAGTRSVDQLVFGRPQGVSYNPLTGSWYQCPHTDINYFVTARKADGGFGAD